MRIIVWLLMISFCFLKCKNKERNIRIKRGDYTLIGHVVNDSILTGLINYYNSNGHLISKVMYSNNYKNGLAINYYSNGTKQDEVNYYFGKMDGYHVSFDTAGSVVYTDYYFFGKQIGPVFFYQNKKVQEYYFTNFEGEKIFQTQYDEQENLISSNGEYFNANMSRSKKDNVYGIKLFLYFVYPPKTSIDYKLGLLDSLHAIQTLEVFPKDKVFCDTFLSIPAYGSYCLLATIVDSFTSQKRTLLKEIRID